MVESAEAARGLLGGRKVPEALIHARWEVLDDRAEHGVLERRDSCGDVVLGSARLVRQLERRVLRVVQRAFYRGLVLPAVADVVDDDEQELARGQRLRGEVSLVAPVVHAGSNLLAELYLEQGDRVIIVVTGLLRARHSLLVWSSCAAGSRITAQVKIISEIGLTRKFYVSAE